jgi:putative flippase GtrA
MMENLFSFIKKIIRFIGCGAVCGGIDYAIMITLTEIFEAPYLASSAIAYILATTLNYFISSRFVFEHKNRRSYDLPAFLLLGIVALLLNVLVMWLVTEKLGVVYYISKFAASAVSGLWNIITRKVLLEKPL